MINPACASIAVCTALLTVASAVPIGLGVKSRRAARAGYHGSARAELRWGARAQVDAVAAMSGKDVQGRKLRVELAKKRASLKERNERADAGSSALLSSFLVVALLLPV